MENNPIDIPYIAASLIFSEVESIANGIRHITAAPNVVPTKYPLNSAAIGFIASSSANAAPPASVANIIPAKADGSAPKDEKTGPITGDRTCPINDERLMKPVIAIISFPEQQIPRSNSAPIPYLLSKR